MIGLTSEAKETQIESGGTPLIHEFIDRGELKVHGGYYSLDAEAVSIIASR